MANDAACNLAGEGGYTMISEFVANSGNATIAIAVMLILFVSFLVLAISVIFGNREKYKHYAAIPLSDGIATNSPDQVPSQKSR